MKPFLSYLFFSILLFTCTITPIASYTQVKSFGNIVLTTNETLYFDLHEYFAGSISTFSVDSPYTVTPKSQERSPQSSINVSNIVAVDIPKGLFDNWVRDQYWIFLDSNNTLQYFSQTGDPSNPSLTYAKSITFLTATYTCQSLLRIDIDLIAVGCLEIFSPSLNKTHIYFVQISTGQLQGEFVLKYGNNVYLEKFPNDIRYVIVYSKTDISCDVSGQVVTLDITDPTNPTQMNNTFRASTFNVPNFCLQDFGILNGIFYFATSDGTIFLAENPLNDPPGPLNRFQINDVILTMSVVSGAYYGQPTTTIVAASTNYVYYYDWTDTTIDGVPVNKYSLSPIGTSVQSVNYVQISQDFVSAIVTTSTGGCSMAVYYLDQSLPEDIYYMNNCPINSGLIDSARPANTFFFASNNAQITSVSMLQISRSILQISSSSPINATSYLTVNSDRIPLQIFAIDVADSKVYATSTQPASYGLVVPGQASFDMTGVLNGPFLSYTSNNSDYSILPPFESASLTTDSSIAAIQYSTFYNSEETNTIYWFSFINSTSDDTESSTFLVNQQACTPSAATYSCKSLQKYPLDTTVTDMTANGQYLFYTGYNETDSTDTVDLSDDISGNLITILDYQMNYQGYLLPVNDSDSCTQLLASPWVFTPFLYCLGNSSLFVYRVDNLTAAQSTGVSLALSIFKHGLQNVSIQLNYNFPSILFLQAGNAIYLLETFALMEGGSPILSTILVQSFDQGFSFAVAGQSLIVYIPYSETVIEYDISHPYSPVQLKMLLTIGFSAEQILGESTYADNVYLFGFNAQSSQPVALIYRPRMTANSNYLAAIGLPLTLFDPSKVQTYPRYPVISLGGTELFVMPDGQNFGWSVKSRVQVDFSATNVDDSEASDYEQDVQVSITGTHPVNPIASAIAPVTFDLILTNEKIRAQQTLCYTPSLIKNTPGPNTISFDPRNYFNGFISSYSIAPSTDSEASMIQLVQQVSGGQSLAFTPSTTLIDTLMILNQTFVGQSQNMLYFLKNGTQSSMELGNSSFTCSELTYNSYIQEMLTMCSLENDEYYFSIIKPADGTFVQYPLIATSTAGKKIANVQKVVFTAQAIYILENIDKFGSFIHIFSFTAPYTIQYLDSISSGDLNTDFLTIADLTINYHGTSSQYRLFMIDSANGLRTLDVTFTSKSISFSNANLIPLQGPSNVIWNGIMSVFEVGDTAIPIGLIVTSSNYKSYYIQYSQTSGVTIERNFVPSAGTNIVRPCYADSDTFIMSAYGTDGQKYALVYTISNITSTPNGQNFPVFSQTYTSNAVGTCSFSFDKSDATEPTFYASNAPNLTNYIVSSNISMIFNGSLSSEYIKISATSAVNQDSFNFYLVPPPQSPNSNMLFWYLIIGGVALLITVVLLCYCFIKCKKKRDRVKDTESYYENVKDSEAGRA